jgi:hypothetical protein
MGVDDDYVAYCLNEAVYFFGRSLEHMMDKAGDSAKNENAATSARERVLKQVLEPPKPGAKAAGFMDPAELFKT